MRQRKPARFAHCAHLVILDLKCVSGAGGRYGSVECTTQVLLGLADPPAEAA